MTDDQMEAESHRYSDLAFFILPLSSGKIAVLSPRREIWDIVESLSEAVSAAAAGYARYRPMPVHFNPKKKESPMLRIDLKKFGL